MDSVLTWSFPKLSVTEVYQGYTSILLVQSTRGITSCFFGEWVLIVICTFLMNNSSESAAFLESLNGVLEGVPSGNYLVLLDDFIIQVDTSSETGVCLGQPNLKMSNVLLLDFCVVHNKQRVRVCKFIWQQILNSHFASLLRWGWDTEGPCFTLSLLW